MSFKSNVNEPLSVISLPNRKQSLNLARKHRQYMQFWRLMAILVIIAGIANIVIQLVMSKFLEPNPVELIVTGDERITNPRFSGMDESYRPYILSARFAGRKSGVLDKIELAFPNLDYAILDPVNSSKSLADFGVFDEKKRILTLLGNVRFTTISGYDVQTEVAEIDLRSGKIVGPSPVYIRAQWGKMRASGFKLDESGQYISTIGDVRSLAFTRQE